MDYVLPHSKDLYDPENFGDIGESAT